MILPTTFISAVLMLVISFVCLGSWVNTFKLTGARWRFELFYIDFAVGAVLVSVIAAFTLGSLGSDLAFTDRMLVAGRAAQVFVIAAGAIFNLGNMLLLAAVSLLGIAGAFPFSIGLALVVASFFRFGHGNAIMLIAGILLMIVAVVLDGSACRLRERMLSKTHAAPKDAAAQRPVQAATAARSAAPVSTAAKAAPRTTGKAKARKTGKGLIIGVISGISLGLAYPVAARGLSGDFGLGPYAGMLMIAIGVLLSTIVLNFYFLNIAIEGGPLKYGAYFRGNARQHFLGFGGGALWAAGMLAALLANSAPAQAGIKPTVAIIVPLASVLLVIFWGVTSWKEFSSGSGHSKLALALTTILFLCSVVLLGIGITL